MTWMAKLHDTYKRALELDSMDKDKLLPISHTLQNAHINIVIDNAGNFRRASVLEKTQIILPATESSAGRSSGEAPHPLADKLQYVAKDYAHYGGLKKAYFNSYEEQLRRWCESSFAHPKVWAVYQYIQKGQVIADLICSKIVYVDANKVLLTHWLRDETKDHPAPLLFKILPKEKGILDQGSALVCWTVELEGDPDSNTWTDKSLHQSWINYEAAQSANKGLCYITGNEVALAINHPAKIRHTGDKAKLISSNDTSGYTYRGKFNTDTESCGIGFDVTQKAHNALRWLISRQGCRNGDQVIIAWAVSGKKIPSPLENTYSFLCEDNEEEFEFQHAIDHGKNLGQHFAQKLKKKLAGYHAQLGKYETIIVMGLDSATPGRMAITYYREANAEEFFERLESWHTDFSWPQHYDKTSMQAKNKREKPRAFSPVSTPAPKLIAEAAYGVKLQDNLKKSTIERLIPCIIEKQPFPKDLVDACIHNASNRRGYEKGEKGRWLKNVSIACALYKGYCLRNNPGMSETERRKCEVPVSTCKQEIN